MGPVAEWLVVAMACISTYIALDDARSRTVSSAACWAVVAAGGICLAASLSGAGERTAMWWAMLALPLGVAAASWASSRMRVVPGGHVLMHEGDALLLAGWAMAVPLQGGVPVAALGFAAGAGAAVAVLVARNLWYNLGDMRARRRFVPFDVQLFIAHRKRKGERFTMEAGATGVGATVKDWVPTGANGGGLFLPAEAEGMAVSPTAPMTLYITAGVMAALCIQQFGAA